MIKPRATQRALPRLVVTAGLLVCCACTPPSPVLRPNANNAIGAINDTLYQIAPGAQYGGEWNSDLPAGVSPDPALFRTRLGNPPVLASHTRWRAANCPLCAVKVRISTLATTGAIDPADPPGSPLAVAHLENLGTAVEAYYGMRPVDEADYYFWVDSTAGDSTRMTLIEVPKGRGVVRAGRQKTVKHCHLHAPNPGAADADFVEYKGPCTAPGYSGIARIHEASMVSLAGFAELIKIAVFPEAVVFSLEGWIDCNSGCCA